VNIKRENKDWRKRVETQGDMGEK